MIKKDSTKIVNFITSGTGVHVLERGHISHIVKLHHFFKTPLFPGYRSDKLSIYTRSHNEL